VEVDSIFQARSHGRALFFVAQRGACFMIRSTLSSFCLMEATMKQVDIVLAVLAMFALCSGCNSGSAGAVKAGGRVTVVGTPVEGLAVTFIPENGPHASGVTDADGRFTLTTDSQGDGAVPGAHKVSVTEVTGAAPPPMPGTPEAAAGTPPAKVPALYGDPKTSGLTATVKSGETNDFTFDLK
jgi:hypothetical protein